MTHTALVLNGRDWEKMIIAAADAVDEAVNELSRLDAAVGDGDHGVNVVTALGYARSQLVTSEDRLPGDVVKIVARGFLDEMGGAAGALFGSLFRVMGRSFGDAEQIDAQQLADALAGGVETVMRRGQTSPGDKTMVDALVPAVAAANEAAEAGLGIGEALAAIAAAARSGAVSTTSMPASRGRAKYAGDKAVGVADAGATTVAIVLEAWSASSAERIGE
ncbi:MAG: dihydroxyacetone kinase subunit L [bacterium]|nr:dihydroxyacetone kinase subunit L [bacterium]